MNKISLIIGLMMVLFIPSVLAVDVNYISDVNIVSGSSDSFIESTKVFNSAYYRINESSSSPGLEFYFNVSNIDGNLSELVVNQRYVGGSSHEVYFYIYDHYESSWIQLREYLNSPNFEQDTFDLSYLCDRCLVNGTVMFKYLHPDNGITSHHFDVDYFILSSTVTESIVEDDSSILDLDLSDTFTIILISILIVGAILAYFLVSATLGGSIIFLLGLMLLFNGFNPLISFIIVVIGVMMIFIE